MEQWRIRIVSDLSRRFTWGLAALWVALVALPLLLSIRFGQPLGGVPVAGAILWFALLRTARLLSPAARADRLIRHARYAEALALCDAALAIQGQRAWTGPRRLVWLNRRATALLSLWRADHGLRAALAAMDARADPETIGAVALALLWLNRHDEAWAAARLASDLTRHRSLVAHAVMAQVALARGLPAEAEALASSGLADIGVLLAPPRPEHHLLCLAAMRRASQTLGRKQPATEYLAALRREAAKHPRLRMLSLLEEADARAATLDPPPPDPDPTTRPTIHTLLTQAVAAGRSYTLWYIAQPGTLTPLRSDDELTTLEAAAREQFTLFATHAPDADTVAHALATARIRAVPTSRGLSSEAALASQVATLAGTAILLLLWTLRFFLY